jgi:hypothetical protein
MNTYMLREDDYFPTVMRDFYETAYKTPAAGKGKSFRSIHQPTTITKKHNAGVTMFTARCAYLKNNIPGPEGPFSYLSGWAEEDSSKVMKEVSDKLRKDIDGILLQVQNAFERMKKKKENDTAQGKRFRTELHQLVAEARRIMDGVTQESLEACKQYK